MSGKLFNFFVCFYVILKLDGNVGENFDEIVGIYFETKF